MRAWQSFNRLIVHNIKYKGKLFLWIGLCLLIWSGYGNPSVTMESDSLWVTEEAVQLAEADIGYSSQALRVMTFNIRHAKGMDGKVDLNRIANVISSVGADIVMLQEVDRYHIRSGWADQIKLLGEQLEMAWAYAPALKWGWTQYGNALLSRYPIEAMDILNMPGKQEPRNVLFAKLSLDTQPMYIFNTHLGLDSNERRQQMSMFQSWVNQIEPGGHRSLFAGDFNMEGNDPLIEEQEQYWYRLKMSEPTFYSGKQIDHLFTNQAVKVDHIGVVDTKASDHYPVWADIRWPDAKQMR